MFRRENVNILWVISGFWNFKKPDDIFTEPEMCMLNPESETLG